MSNKDNSLALLPNGFTDLLPPDAQKEADSIHILMDVFQKYGYRRIKPPLLEFEDSLLAPGPGARLAPETFRLMDPVTHRMLGVRSDITPQIARIASSRLNAQKRPLRLAYANDVLRTRGSQMRTERQFTQVGCELVGNKQNIDGDVEISMLALLGLKALGISDLTLDFSVPGFVSAVIAPIDSATTKKDILKAVSRRDEGALKAFNLPQTDMLVQVLQACGRADEALNLLDKVSCSPPIDENIKRLRSVCEAVQSALNVLGINDVSLSVDLLEQDGFEYHKALGFTLFSKNVHGELGRGGCYDVRFGTQGNINPETAKGFTLYMDTIAKCVAPPADDRRIFVPVDVGWGVLVRLQNDGWITVRGAGDDIPSECTHIYENEKIKEIS